MLGLVDRNIQTVTVTVFHMLDMKDIKKKKTQIQPLGMKTTVPEMKNTTAGLITD